MATKGAETTALATIPKYEGPSYEVMKRDPERMRAIFKANLTDDVTAFDLDGVSVPGGGGLAWSVADINDEPESMDELEGVVILYGDRRAYCWPLM